VSLFGLSLSIFLLGCMSTTSKDRPPYPTDPRTADDAELNKYLNDWERQQRK